MKTMINFTTSQDDIERYFSAADLRKFYRRFGCSGLELMPLDNPYSSIVRPDMVIGVHMCCFGDWMYSEPSSLLSHFQKDLDYAVHMKAEYVVFHVTQVSDEECISYQMQHTDEEVIDAASKLINTLLDGKDYSFWFLMENLWWPGLNFLRPSATRRLFENVHYPKKGFMLDTGHFMHTNLDLHTQKEALTSLHAMLDAHQEFMPFIKGLHLNQSLTGDYVKQWLKEPHILEEDPRKRSFQVFEHIFAIDRHLPFTEPGVRELVERISPLYLTYEYITRNREEHARYLKAGVYPFSQGPL